MNKTVLVTGATGFVGSNLVKGLIHNRWKVDIVTRPSSDLKLLKGMTEQLNIYEYDGDQNALMNIMDKSKPTVVFHLASLFLSAHKADQVNALISSNILFGVQLLEAMSQSQVQRFVNTSTSWEHYENKEYSPVNLYAATKKAFHDILQYYIEAKGIQAITLKLFDTYGSNDPRSKLLNLLFKIAETGEKLAMSVGEQKIDLVHIDDVINGYCIAAQRLLTGQVTSHEVYGLSSKKPISIKGLVAVVEEKTGKKLNIEWGGRPYREREVMEPYSDFKSLPNWNPMVDLNLPDPRSNS